MKGDSGYCSVFTEQGASASHLTAAEVLDVISRLLGCSRQASDAVSAHTHKSKSTTHQNFFMLKGFRKQDDHNSWTFFDDAVVPLEINLSTDIHWQDSYGKNI